MAQGHELKLNMYQNTLHTVVLFSALLFARNCSVLKKQQQEKKLVVQHLHWGNHGLQACSSFLFFVPSEPNPKCSYHHSNLKAENDSDCNFLDASVGIQISAI